MIRATFRTTRSYPETSGRGLRDVGWRVRSSRSRLEVDAEGVESVDRRVSLSVVKVVQHAMLVGLCSTAASRFDELARLENSIAATLYADRP